jgi:hypothetical protein
MELGEDLVDDTDGLVAMVKDEANELDNFTDQGVGVRQIFVKRHPGMICTGLQHLQVGAKSFRDASALKVVDVR